MIRGVAGLSPQRKARITGGLFLLLVLTSLCTEFLAPGRSGPAAHLAAGIIEVSCMVVVTLLLYDLLRPVQSRLSLVAACTNFLAVVLELLRLQPRGMHIGIGLHGVYWLLIAWLIVRSSFVPHILGALLGIAGVCWLIFLCTGPASHLSRYILGSALLVEGAAMVCLFIMGLGDGGGKDPAGEVRAHPRM